MLIDRGEHVLSELLLLQRARCERSERAYAARMDQLQQRCKQQRPLRSHSSPVQLGVMRGDMMSAMATWLDGPDGGASESTSEGAVRQRLGVGGRARYRWNARKEPDTIHATATPCANGVVKKKARAKITCRRVVHCVRATLLVLVGSLFRVPNEALDQGPHLGP